MQTQERTPAAQRAASAQAMHKLVFIGAGIWVAFMLTFVVAYFRVAASDKYEGGPFKSLTEAAPQRPATTY